MIHSNALKWSFLSEFASKAIPPIVFIALAKLLTPEDFGVISAAMVVVAFSQVFWEAGMTKALIQRSSDVEDAANAAFWINMVLGCLTAMVMYLLANPVAQSLFHDSRVALVLQAMTIYVILGAASAVPIALLQKEMDFRQLFWVRFATVSLPGIASIPLAFSGMNHWALVAGILIGQSMQVIMLWSISGWRPTWSLNTRVAGEMGRFGAWVAAFGLLGWFYIWADSLIVGIYLGSHELGVYRTGNQVATMIFIAIFGPITPVLYSHLSKMNCDKERLAQAIEKVIKVLALTAIPIAAIVHSLAEPIGAIVFGEKWNGIGLIIGVMALTQGYSWIVGMNGEAYRAMGKPSYETIVPALTLGIYLGGYMLSIRQGIEVFAWTRLGLTLCGVILHLCVLRMFLPISLMSITRCILKLSVVAVLVTGIVQVFSIHYLEGTLAKMIVGGTLNLALVGTAIFLLERNGILIDVAKLFRTRKA